MRCAIGWLLILLFGFGPGKLSGQEVVETKQAKLRGSVTPEREWWDLKHYDLAVEVFPESKSLKGSNRITFTTLAAGQRMQVDLQTPLKITRVIYGEKDLDFVRDGNAYLVVFDERLDPGVSGQIEVFYEGVPVESKNPPWSGGITWTKDELDNHFIATTCQGIGASIWWPNKDHGYDEPDNGCLLYTSPSPRDRG